MKELDEVASKHAMLLPGWFAFARPDAAEQKERRQFGVLTIIGLIRQTVAMPRPLPLKWWQIPWPRRSD
jgi:hypothetical protein